MDEICVKCRGTGEIMVDTTINGRQGPPEQHPCECRTRADQDARLDAIWPGLGAATPALGQSAAYAGGEAIALVDTPIGRLGLSICYDLRFPELYRALVEGGAEVIAIPAAFTVPTGEAHWHTLVRARAIETGCHVIAAAQCGVHADGRATYGHSLAVDPWGVVLGEAAAKSGAGDQGFDLIAVEIDAEAVTKARQAIPLARSRTVRSITL